MIRRGEAKRESMCDGNLAVGTAGFVERIKPLSLFDDESYEFADVDCLFGGEPDNGDEYNVRSTGAGVFPDFGFI